MEEKIQIYGYQLGFSIPTKTGTKNYEMNSKGHNFDKCSEEEWDIWSSYISKAMLMLFQKATYLKYDIEKVKQLELKIININNIVSNTYAEIHKEIAILIPHLVYYYLKYDKEKIVVIMLKLIKDLYNVIDKENNCQGIFTYSNGLKMYTDDLLGLKEELNFVTKTVERLKEHNDYFKIDNFDITEITNIYKKEEA